MLAANMTLPLGCFQLASISSPFISPLPFPVSPTCASFHPTDRSMPSSRRGFELTHILIGVFDG
jgi:hypothetical protein